MQVEREAYGGRSLKDGFRNPALIRFTSGEDFYLSATHGGPRMWVNVEVSPGCPKGWRGWGQRFPDAAAAG